MRNINRLSLHRLNEYAENLSGSRIDHRSYVPGEIIYSAETYAKGLFFLEKGSILVKTTAPDGSDDVIRILGQDSFFGLLPLIRRTRYTSTAVALQQETRVTFIPRPIVGEALKDYQFVIGFLKILSERIHDNEIHLLHIKNKNAEERLAYILIELSNVFQTKVNDPAPMITIRKKELASYMGVTPETLSRRLADFEKQGWIELHLKGIRVVQIESLQNMAEGFL